MLEGCNIYLCDMCARPVLSLTCSTSSFLLHRRLTHESSRSQNVLYASAGNGRAAVVQSPELSRIQVAKKWVQAGCGLEDPSLMADGFKFVDPLRGTQRKQAYLKNLERLDLQSAFPDLDLRAHDFRVDKEDASKVWYTTRVTGTHKFPLVLEKEEIAPTGIKMELPPESNCVVVKDGKVVRAVGGGIVLDRSVGNSAGLGGLYGVAAALGRPVSAFKHTPPQKVFQDFFRRTFKPSTAAPPVFSPLPEAVMIGLAKGLLASDFGAADPELLAKDFKFVGPLVGPLPRETFVKAFSSFNLRRAFPDIKNEAYDFRVDPYDPARVWFTVRSQGTFTGAFGEGRNSLPPNGNKYRSGPEGISVTFNSQGQCVKLTVGVLMDPDDGDTGGLGGVFGVLFAVGTPLPPFVTRPLPQHLRHWKNYLLDALTSPFTGTRAGEGPSADETPKPAVVAEAKSKAPEPAPKKAPVSSSPLKAKSPPTLATAKSPPSVGAGKPVPPPVLKKANPPPPPVMMSKPPSTPSPLKKPQDAPKSASKAAKSSGSTSNGKPFSLFGGGDKKPAASAALKKPIPPPTKVSKLPAKPGAKPAPLKAQKTPVPTSKKVAAGKPKAPKTGFSLFGGNDAGVKADADKKPKIAPKPSIQSQASRPKVAGVAKKK